MKIPFCQELRLELKLVTDPTLIKIQEELKLLEPIFHHPELGSSRSDLENLTDLRYWEVGASGQRYSREECIETTLERFQDPTWKKNDIWETSDFYCLEISPDHYLLTYQLIQDNKRITRRSTIWYRTQSTWKILYHQGTIVKE